MSRRNSKPGVQQPKIARHERLIHAVLRLPRIWRIILAAIFALATTLALSPIVDAIYLRYLFTEGTRIVPSLVSAGFGLAMYVSGWLLIVGTVGEDPQARFAVLWYFVLGTLAILLTVLWMVQGLTILNFG